MIRKSKIIFDYVNKSRLELRIRSLLSLDYHVRWNTTFRMISVFLDYKQLIEEITAMPQKIIGLEKQKMNKLRKFELKQEDWQLLDIALVVLEPFYLATKMLSGQEYPTLSKAKAIENLLITKFSSLSSIPHSFLTMELASLIFPTIQMYLTCPTKLSKEQRDTTLVRKFDQLFFVLFFFDNNIIILCILSLLHI